MKSELGVPLAKHDFILGLVLTHVGQSDDEVGDQKCSSSVQTIGSIFVKCCAVFKKARDVGDGHETHESTAKELRVKSVHE